MGILVDYFIAVDDAQAAALLNDYDAVLASDMDGAHIEPITELTGVEAYLGGRTYDAIVEDPDSFADVADDGDGGYIVKIGRQFVERLAAASEAELISAGAMWAADASDIDPTDAAEYLRMIQGYAQRARTEQMGLYCRISP
jgi:hypothetical protein